MNNSTRTALIISVLIGSASAWAATSFDYTQSGNFPITKTGTNACDAILATETINPALSANVAGAFNCTNGVNVGVATANAKGRGRAYRVHSAGGNSPQESTVQARFSSITAAKTEAQTQADNANAEAGT